MNKKNAGYRFGVVAVIAGTAVVALAYAQEHCPTCDADLSLEKLEVDTSKPIHVGDKPWVTVVVKNNRNSSCTSYVKLFLRMAAPMAPEIPWGEYDIGVLTNGQELSFISDFQVPNHLRAGDYEVLARCGFEANEPPGLKKNNESKPFPIKLLDPSPTSGMGGLNSDLILLDPITFPSSAATGTFATVTIKIKNQQNSSCLSTANVYLKNTVSPFTTNMWYSFSVSALSNQGVYTNTSTKLVPSLPNTIHCIMVVCGAGSSGCEASGKQANNTNDCSTGNYNMQITY